MHENLRSFQVLLWPDGCTDNDADIHLVVDAISAEVALCSAMVTSSLHTVGYAYVYVDYLLNADGKLIQDVQLFFQNISFDQTQFLAELSFPFCLLDLSACSSRVVEHG